MMDVVAAVESLWRYPLKSMRGEQLDQLYAGCCGIYGDRVFAIHDQAAPEHFPYLTGRQQASMLLFEPRFRDPDGSGEPWLAADRKHDPSTLLVDVKTPEGDWLSVDDPLLLARLREALGDRHELSLLRSQRGMTDAHPVSLFSIQTARQLGEELGIAIDKRRFRANIYLDLAIDQGFGEDQFVGRTLHIGREVVLNILERDPRCKMITLDPDTAAATPEVMKCVAHEHESKAGVYAAVLHPGTIRQGDQVCLGG